MKLFPRLALLSCLFIAPLVSADAIMLSRAMFSDTIAEYFVEQNGVRVELEVGMENIAAFRNLLPDEIYQEMGYDARPYPERLQEFFTSDLVIGTGKEVLQGELRTIGCSSTYSRYVVTTFNELAGNVQSSSATSAEQQYILSHDFPFIITSRELCRRS